MCLNITVYKIHCYICDMYIQSNVEKLENGNVGHFSMDICIIDRYKFNYEAVFCEIAEDYVYKLVEDFGSFKICPDCQNFRSFVEKGYKRNIRYKDSLKSFLKPYYRVFRYNNYIYNHFFVKHAEMSKLLHEDLMREMFSPARICKYLNSGDDMDVLNYLS